MEGSSRLGSRLDESRDLIGGYTACGSSRETKPCKDLAEMWAGQGFRSRLVPSRDINDEFTTCGSSRASKP